MRVYVLVVATIVALSLTAAALADQPSQSGSETVTCRFDVHRALTQCVHSLVTVQAGACLEAGYRLYARDEADSARAYRGNAILSSFDGLTVAGGYAAVVRPHVRPLSDSGPHAFSESFTVEDTTCTG
jgi:hypothetical protein